MPIVWPFRKRYDRFLRKTLFQTCKAKAGSLPCLNCVAAFSGIIRERRRVLIQDWAATVPLVRPLRRAVREESCV